MENDPELEAEMEAFRRGQKVGRERLARARPIVEAALHFQARRLIPLASYVAIADALTTARNTALQDAAKAICDRCRESPWETMEQDGEWWHTAETSPEGVDYPPEPCPASAIYALRAGKEQRPPR